MIVSYLTDTYFEWGKLFLKSLRLTNGHKELVLLHARNLYPTQINELCSLYPGLKIENELLNLKTLSLRYDISEKRLLKSRQDVANGKMEGDHRLWMDVTSVYDRMNSLYSTVMRGTFDYIIHFDIDVLFRKDITWLKELANLHEIGLIIRGDRENPKVAGGLFTLKGMNGIGFLSEWCSLINHISEWERVPVPFQQIACNQAFIKLRDYINYAQLPYGDDNKIDSKLGRHADIWLFKTKRKLESLQMAKVELERMKWQEYM